MCKHCVQPRPGSGSIPRRVPLAAAPVRRVKEPQSFTACSKCVECTVHDSALCCLSESGLSYSTGCPLGPACRIVADSLPRPETRRCHAWPGLITQTCRNQEGEADMHVAR